MTTVREYDHLSSQVSSVPSPLRPGEFIIAFKQVRNSNRKSFRKVMIVKLDYSECGAINIGEAIINIDPLFFSVL